MSVDLSSCVRACLRHVSQTISELPHTSLSKNLKPSFESLYFIPLNKNLLSSQSSKSQNHKGHIPFFFFFFVTENLLSMYERIQKGIKKTVQQKGKPKSQRPLFSWLVALERISPLTLSKSIPCVFGNNGDFFTRLTPSRTPFNPKMWSNSCRRSR